VTVADAMKEHQEKNEKRLFAMERKLRLMMDTQSDEAEEESTSDSQ